MFGAPPGFQPPELVDAFRQRAPQLKPQLILDVNHYTLLFDPDATRAVAHAITG